MIAVARALGFGASLAVLGSAHAETKEPAPVPLTFEVDVDALPQGDVPSMLPDTERPKAISEGVTKGQGITLVRSGTSYDITPEATTPASVQVRRPTTTPTAKSSTSCDPRDGGMPWPLRWESVELAADGTATLSVRDGWMDVRSCKIALSREKTLVARAVAFRDGVPIVFAMRDADGVTFLVPPADNAAGEASPGALKWQRGPVSRVRLPIARGGSAAIAISLDGGRASTWAAQMAGKKSAATTSAQPLTLRIEASQAVSEDKPTILIRVAAR